MDRVFGNRSRVSMGVGRGEARRGAIRGRGCSAFVFVSNFRFVRGECVCVCSTRWTQIREIVRVFQGLCFAFPLFSRIRGAFLSLSLSAYRFDLSPVRDSTRFYGLCVPCLAARNGASESKACFRQAGMGFFLPSRF